jgi:hypothetical protein
MTYKICCPNCQTNVPRVQCFFTPRLDYRCRKCGVSFRISAAGWVIALGVAALQVVWFMLVVRHIVSPAVGLLLVALTLLLALWLLPYFVSVQRS